MMVHETGQMADSLISGGAAADGIAKKARTRNSVQIHVAPIAPQCRGQESPGRSQMPILWTAQNDGFVSISSKKVVHSTDRRYRSRRENAAFKAQCLRVGPKNIVIAGAGPTGVEVAGELAARYGKQKKITLIIHGEVPLGKSDGVLHSVLTAVDKNLQKMGISLVRRARVESNRSSEDGTTQTLTLDNGSTIITDCYLPLHGIHINTDFVPESFLDSKENIKLDDKLRVISTENIWAVGDVGNIEPKQLTVTDNQIIHLACALDATLTGEGSVAPFQPVNKTMVFLSLGTKYATGQIGNWKLWGILVLYVKGRKLFVDTSQGYVGGKHLQHASM